MPEWNVRRRSGKLLRVYPIVKPSRYLPRLANIVAEIGRIAPIDVILILIFIQLIAYVVERVLGPNADIKNILGPIFQGQINCVTQDI